MKRLSDQHGTFQLEASVATRRLEQTETDLVALRAAVNSERSLREKREGALGSLRRELALEKGSVEELKREATAAKEARRRVELQVRVDRFCVSVVVSSRAEKHWYIAARQGGCVYWHVFKQRRERVHSCCRDTRVGGRKIGRVFLFDEKKYFKERHGALVLKYTPEYTWD